MRTWMFIVMLAWSTAIVAQEPKVVSFESGPDKALQQARFFAPQSAEPVPLVVLLHTWSGNFKQKRYAAVEAWCKKKGWAYIHPDFRGSNKRPQATGSEFAVADIVSAVAYAEKNARIDNSSIYLVGASGGGHAALLMAGRHPKIWAGVSAWVPISDLRAWHAQSRKYAKDMEKSCGGAPGASPKVDAEYTRRSPLTYLKNAKGVTLHIHGGISDRSVPVSHSLHAFNQVAEPKDRLSEEDIKLIARKRQVPAKLKTGVSDSGYGKKPPLIQRTSGKATLTVFKGGHEIIEPAAIAWIEAIHGKRSGVKNQVQKGAASKKAKRILFFGDSITASGKWVKRVGADGFIEALNEGKSGLRVAWAKKELSKRLAKHSELDQIVIMLGVNDLPARDKRPGDVKVAGCIKNMRETIDLALTRFKPQDIILVAPCTVNPDTMSRMNLKKGYQVTGPLLAKLEKGYRQLAQEKGTRFESLLSVVSKENFKDGLHPNQAGDDQIAEAVLKFLTAKR